MQRFTIARQIASTPTLFSKSCSLRPLAVCRPQKKALGKTIWLQWRSDIFETEAYFEDKDKSFYKKKSTELLEKHWNQCITLEGDYVDE